MAGTKVSTSGTAGVLLTAASQMPLTIASTGTINVANGNNSSERELRPAATYRKVTGGFRSNWGADFHAGVL